MVVRTSVWQRVRGRKEREVYTNRLLWGLGNMRDGGKNTMEGC